MTPARAVRLRNCPNKKTSEQDATGWGRNIRRNVNSIQTGSGADRIVGAIRTEVRYGDADYAAMT